MKLIRSVLGLFILLVVLFFVFREPVLKAAVKFAARDMTGLSVDIDNLKIGVLRPVIDIGGVRIYNPEGFPDRMMMDAPVLFVHYVPSDIVRGKLTFKEIRISLDEFRVIKTKAGETNVGHIKGISVPQKPQPGQDAKKAPAPAVSIGLLKLRVGRVVYKDYTLQPPSVKSFDININKEFRDITDLQQVIKLIVFESLLKTNIQGLSDVDLRSLQENVKSVVGSGKELITGTAAVATGVAKGAIGTTAEVLKKTATGLKGLFAPQKQE